MSKNLKRTIYLMILIIPVTTVYFIGKNSIEKYKDSLKEHKVLLAKHVEDVKNKEIEIYVNSKKANGKQWVDNMMLVFADKYSASQVDVKKELEETIDIAYNAAQEVKSRYKKNKNSSLITKELKLKLSQIKRESEIFLVDYSGNTLFGSNSQEDINARTIVLEEIQKVRRRGGGYIVSDVDKQGTQRHIAVKDLGFKKLFIGADIYVKNDNKALKENLLDIVNNVLLEKDDCVSIMENKRSIYRSIGCSDSASNKHYYDSHFKEIDWTLAYSFSEDKKVKWEVQKLKNFEQLLPLEFN